MDTTDQRITFGDQGVCDHCQNFYKNVLPNWHTDEKGWQALQKTVEIIKKEGTGKDFDCIQFCCYANLPWDHIVINLIILFS